MRADESPRSRKRRELYAEGERIVAEQQREKERLKTLDQERFQDNRGDGAASARVEEDEEMEIQEDNMGDFINGSESRAQVRYLLSPQSFRARPFIPTV